jgi:hypothetical protein
LWDALRILFLSGVIAFVFKTAKEAGQNKGRWLALRNGVFLCVGLALFAAATVGSPSCEESEDPLRGGCSQYADDGYEPNADERTARFIFWIALLGIPVALGVLDAHRPVAEPRHKPPVKLRDE